MTVKLISISFSKMLALMEEKFPDGYLMTPGSWSPCIVLDRGQ